MTQQSPNLLCGNCGHGSIDVCSRCKSFSYCSRECQIADFPNHRQYCKDQTNMLSGNEIVLRAKTFKDVCTKFDIALSYCCMDYIIFILIDKDVKSFVIKGNQTKHIEEAFTKYGFHLYEKIRNQIQDVYRKTKGKWNKRVGVVMKKEGCVVDIHLVKIKK